MAQPQSLEIPVVLQGAWRNGVVSLAALSCVSSLLWWAAHAPPRPGWMVAAALAGCALALAVASSLTRLQPEGVLRWDRRQWWLAIGAARAETGALDVAIDLGDWMLLRFAPQGRAPWRPRRWIPVQRRGLEGAWQALRCTVHATRPGSEVASA